MIKIIRTAVLTALHKFSLVSYLAAENLALRQQLIVLRRSHKRPAIRVRDRLFWVGLSRIWPGWREALLIVKPDTVVRWHRQGFRSYWRRKCRGNKPGRPPIDPEVKALIFKIADANPTWGAPKIHGEMLKLGIEIFERSISGLLFRRSPKPPSQTWKTFIKNHMTEMVAVDFLVVPTIHFRMLFVFIVLSHARRQVIHFNVTAHPTAEWTARQINEAFPWDAVPRFLLRDRGSAYGDVFRKRVRSMEIEEVLTAVRSPWQNAYVERLNGSVRRECLDHLIIWNERHLSRVLREYFDYYNQDRTHLGLEKDTPKGRPISNRASPSSKLVELPRVGGLHHRYEWSQAV
jgi:transposase InsO family protein